MLVNEIFHSLQGEGQLAGMPSAFVRLAGCPLRCRWCDTKYAWWDSSGQEYTIEQIVQKVSSFDTPHVVVTGGEPMINAELAPLLKALAEPGVHITIETCGIGFVPEVKCNLMSISPKMSNSNPVEPEAAQDHEENRLDTAVLQELINNYQYQLKFVVDSSEDLDEIAELLSKLENINPYKVFLMPQATNRLEYLEKAPLVAELCRTTGFVFSSRLQVLLWDNQRGK